MNLASPSIIQKAKGLFGKPYPLSLDYLHYEKIYLILDYLAYPESSGKNSLSITFLGGLAIKGTHFRTTPRKNVKQDEQVKKENIP